MLGAPIPLSGRAFFAKLPMLYRDGLRAHFLFVAQLANIEQLIESTANGLGYELVDVEHAARGGLLRVFIDRTAGPTGRVGAVEGITLDDCERMTRQLQRVLEVEGIDYARLEVSSPGLDRVLRRPADFRRFTGATAEVRLRVPVDGRRRFVGTVRDADDAGVRLEVDGALVRLGYGDIARARLAPQVLQHPTQSRGRVKGARGEASPRAVKTP